MKTYWQLLFLIVFFGVNVFSLKAQCKTFYLSDRGDTLNCIDTLNMKQGKWLEKQPVLRGNPGYDEEGIYIDDRKEGVWRRYLYTGDLVSIENYRWGLLNGMSQYFSLMGLEREESWYAIDPKKKFDTLDVPDLNIDAVYHSVIIPNPGKSYKHGVWNWFDPITGRIVKSIQYIRDSVSGNYSQYGVNNRRKDVLYDAFGNPIKTEKPKIVIEWERKNKGKKRKVIDGSTIIQ